MPWRSTKNNSDISFVENSNYICRFCSNLHPCHKCRLQITESNIKTSLYCTTCKVRICDDCNTSFSSDQLKIFKQTDTPFYCKTCNDFYPCKVCKTQCYNDIVHDPSIFCDNCQKWLHHACSKLSHTQFNRLGKENIDYVCHVCIAENVPFVKLSKNMFTKSVVDCSPNTSAIRMNSPVCTLCVACNQSCESCQVCPDFHRICDGCSSQCRYLTIGEYNNQIAQCTGNENNLKLLHVNIRSLSKHITTISNMIVNEFNTPIDIICFSETKLEDPDPNDVLTDTYQIEQVQLPGYKFIHNPSKTNAGGTGIYVSQLSDFFYKFHSVKTRASVSLLVKFQRLPGLNSSRTCLEASKNAGFLITRISPHAEIS